MDALDALDALEIAPPNAGGTGRLVRLGVPGARRAAAVGNGRGPDTD
jgi:hypothetical protein